MLNETSAILYIGLLYLFSFFLGYALLFWARTKGLLNLPFFVKLPICLALGLLSLTVLLFITGFVGINGYTPVVITLFSLLLVSYYHLKFKSEIKTMTNITSFDNILPAALFIITFLHFSTVISIIGWPPPGDIFNHGLFTSILEYNQKITFSLAPYDASLPLTPPISGFTGLHIISANFSMLTGVFPGEAVFIVGGAIVILIPMLLYTSTYILTKSNILSLFAFLSTFLIGLDLEQWALGYFYNGPFQNLFGFLAVLLFLIFPIATSEIQFQSNSSMRNRTLLLVIILAVFLVYPPFVIFPILYLLLSALRKGKIVKALRNISIGRKNVLLFSLFLVIALLFLIVLPMTINQEFLFQLLQGIYLRISQVYGSPGYAIYPPIFYTSAIGVAILVGGIISIFFVVRHLHAKVALFYLVVFLPVMFSLHPALFPIFSSILPNRSLMACSLISWVLLSAFLSHISTDFRHISIQLAFKNRLYVRQVNPSNVAVLLIILLVFTPSLFSNFAFEQANKYSWLMRNGFANDYDVLLWVHENIKPDELILDDFSFTSWYLLSFSVKNVTSVRWWGSDFKRERAIETLNFLKDPTNTSQLLSLISKYDIKYVLVTSERAHYVWKGIGGDDRYVAKPFKPAEYKSIFGNYPFLKLMYKHGDAGIYKVSPFTVEQRNALSAVETPPH